jgi:hypothetical protein
MKLFVPSIAEDFQQIVVAGHASTVFRRTGVLPINIGWTVDMTRLQQALFQNDVILPTVYKVI